MKKYFLMVCAYLFFYNIAYSQTERTKELINFDWKFILGDDKEACAINYDDSDWRVLNLPHDWSIEGEFKETNPAGVSGAFLPGGIGWYRKKINLKTIDNNALYAIHFDGVYLNSDVWINGEHLGFFPNGYIGFEYDLTPYLKEGENTIAVRVDHSKLPSGRWYTGSGIYRNVWFKTSHKTYVSEQDLFITTPVVMKEKATIHIDAIVKNELKKAQKVKVSFLIKDDKNNIVSSVEKDLKLSSEEKITKDIEVEQPSLWSPSNPYNYTLEVVIQQGTTVFDRYTTNFGIRKLEWIAQKGLFLNDESILMKGLSNHQDAGAVGVAVPEQVLYKRLKSLKEMGCNALRTAHHPFAPEFYAMCDTMGFMVMDEAFDGWWNAKAKYDYGLYFEKHWEKDLESFIKRDRNHPSVVMWSVGNEIHAFTDEQQEQLVSGVKKWDSSRPVTQGRGYKGKHIDIAGFNGNGEYRKVIENYHEKHPDQLIVGTEITHTLQTRGIYRTQTWYRTKDNPAPWEKPEQFKKMEDRVYKIPNLSEKEIFTEISPKYQSSYDNSVVRVGVRDEWNRVEEWDYYVGNFRWTGFDYLGESFNWPARTANFGIIDLAGFPKDHYYLYQSLWSDKPMVHMLPHWNHEGKEGVEIPMVVYTNCKEAELFLNGTSLGKKKMTSERQIVWNVPYEKGTLEVVASTDGKEQARKSITTASKAYTMTVDLDKNSMNADRSDVLHCEVTVVDKEGNFVPTASDEIEFSVSGAADIIGIENGDILDMSSSKKDFTRKTFNGKCLLLIQSNGQSGNINIQLSSKTLEDVKIVIESNSI